MNGKEQHTIETIVQMMNDNQEKREAIHSDVQDIKFCLIGDPKKGDDLGLQGMVSDNTKFRKSTTKVLWAMVTGFIGIAFVTIKKYLW